MTRPPLEVADVIRQCGKAFLRARGSSLTSAQRYVLKSLATCRTAALGGHLERCDQCGHERPAYNSCRNRHCPKCQAAARADWADARRAELLPVPYHHVVFTLPEPVARIALQNKTIVYNMLFAASAQTLQQIAADPKHLGAKIGLLSVLHSWGQNLEHHPHIHCLVPGGGLSADETEWISCAKDFFLPVRVLSRVFRGKFLQQLKKAYEAGQLSFHGRLEPLGNKSAFGQLISQLYEKEWIVYSKAPCGRRPERILKYLARYTNRVAISNQRLLALEDGRVTFRWKNYAKGNHWQTMRLDGVEFLRRFLLHVLPSGFVRIRHYGLLANCHRKEKLARCRELLNRKESQDIPDAAEPEGDWHSDTHDEPNEQTCCPSCRKGRMQVVKRLPRPTIPELLALPWVWDSS
jgi:hypothetical protein